MVLVILVYPALSTGTVSILVRSGAISNADHVYVSVGNFWAHRSGRASSEGWELIVNQTQTLDLVSLQSTIFPFGKGQVSLGNYDGVRMDISNVTWVFNKTTTSLGITSPELQAPLLFTVGSGSGATVSLTITAQKQLIANSDYFAGTLAANLAS